MRTTTALLTGLLLAATTVGCSSDKSYNDIVKDCVTALKDQPSDDATKPDACKDVKDDDYTALVMSRVLDDNGWVDENGDVDMDKLLDDTTSQP